MPLVARHRIRRHPGRPSVSERHPSLNRAALCAFIDAHLTDAACDHLDGQRLLGPHARPAEAGHDGGPRHLTVVGCAGLINLIGQYGPGSEQGAGAPLELLLRPRAVLLPPILA